MKSCYNVLLNITIGGVGKGMNGLHNIMYWFLIWNIWQYHCQNLFLMQETQDKYTISLITIS